MYVRLGLDQAAFGLHERMRKMHVERGKRSARLEKVALPNIKRKNKRPLINSQPDEASEQQRMEWVHSMRGKFSPPGMINEDLSIRQDFFKPEKVFLVEEKKWGNDERDKLYQGLEKYGIGKWREISENLLPKYDDQALRVKASRLMGSQSLARYVGWKGNREAVDAEQAKNRKLGEELGCWKAGVLVENDNGDVAKALDALAKR